MALLGFHVVVSLIALTILSKFGSRVSLLSLFVSKLIRYIAPSNDELRALLPSKSVDLRPRKRRQQKEEEDNNGFNVPRQMPLQIKATNVRVEELERFPLYSSIHWLTLFVPISIIVFCLSEGWTFLFPHSTDINTSSIWLFIGIAFCLQVVARLTALLLSGEDEKSLLFSLSILSFFSLFVLTVFVDRLFDVSLLDAYTNFMTNSARLTQEEVDIKPYSPLLLYISIVMLFSTISCGLIFPSFRFATMYTKSTATAPPATKLLLHATFLLPPFIVVMYTSAVKVYLTEGRRVWMTSEQLDIFRIYLTIVWVFLRLVVFRPMLQAHLDLAYDKVCALQKQTGKIRNTELQSLIFRYYSYLSSAIAQYLSPTLLILFVALLLKSCSNMSWMAIPMEPYPLSNSSTASLSSIFTPSVNKAFFSFSLLALTFANSALSLVGVLYMTYFQRE